MQSESSTNYQNKKEETRPMIFNIQKPRKVIKDFKTEVNSMDNFLSPHSNKNYHSKNFDEESVKSSRIYTTQANSIIKSPKKKIDIKFQDIKLPIEESTIKLLSKKRLKTLLNKLEEDKSDDIPKEKMKKDEKKLSMILKLGNNLKENLNEAKSSNYIIERWDETMPIEVPVPVEKPILPKITKEIKFETKRKLLNILKNHGIQPEKSKKHIETQVYALYEEKLKAANEKLKPFLESLSISELINEFLLNEPNQKVSSVCSKEVILNAVMYNLQTPNNHVKFVNRNLDDIEAFFKQKIIDDKKKDIKEKEKELKSQGVDLKEMKKETKENEKKNSIPAKKVNMLGRWKKNFHTPKKGNSEPKNTTAETQTNTSVKKNDQILTPKHLFNLKKMEIIVSYHKNKQSISKIMESTEMSRSSINYVLKKFDKSGEIRSNYRGRKGVIDEKIKDDIAANLDFGSEPKDIYLEVKKERKIGRATFYRYLRTIGKFSLPKEFNILSQKNIEKRLSYCKEMANMDIDNIIFSDESMIELRRNKQRFFARKGERLIKYYGGGGKISTMVWGAISTKGRVHFKIIPFGKTVDSVYYKKIIEEMIPEANKMFPDGWIFQQDNASCHKSKAVLEFFEKNNIKLLNHPPQSPDLNPIELIWAYLKKKIELSRPKNREDLKLSIENNWNQIPLDVIKNCVEGLKNKFAEVVRNKGENMPLNRITVDYNEGEQNEDKKDKNFR
jgi:transposase